MALGPLLGGISAAAFLRRHWQKAAHLARAAIPGFAGVLDRDALFALAARDDVESRLVQRTGARWSLAHGPFAVRTLRALPARNWTLLVQGVNLHVPAADALLRRFRFVPYARLDDLMVSYAAPGGGVGPHVDAYDVFLLQGFGRRRWRYGRQDDQAFRPGLPLRVLRRFKPTEDAILAPGDMLYLPPAYAHDGVALET
ncbi:MAG: cupin domain-containing protein, partial [Casimicrobiaceae bacterium]